MNEPRFGRRLQDVHELFKIVSKCSHLAVFRPYCILSYYHHYLVTHANDDKIEIIQYGPAESSGKVHEKTIEKRNAICSDLLDFNSGVYLITDPTYPSTDEQKDKAIQRAKLRLGDKMYQASSDNCEHFVVYALTGTPKSDQFENSGIGKRIVAYFVDFVIEWKSSLVKTTVRTGTTTMTEVINNYDFYKNLVLKAINRYPDIIKSTLKFVGRTSESIANMIAKAAASSNVVKVLGYGSTVVEISILLKDIVMYTLNYIDNKIDFKTLLKQMFKRMASATTALCLDWRFIPGFIGSMTSLPQIAGFALVVLGAQLCVSLISPMLWELGEWLFDKFSTDTNSRSSISIGMVTARLSCS